MIKQAAATSYVFRSWGDFPDNTGDWTVLIQFKYNGIPSGFVNVLNFFDGAVDFTDPYLYLGNANSGVSDIFLEYFDGSVFHDTSIHAITSAAQNWAAITYKVSTTTLTFILNGSTIGTITASLAARTWDSLYLIGTTGSGSDSSSAAYLRAWSNVLSLGDLTAEVASITPVITTGLLFTNPLQTSVDLTAHNNTLNHFVGIGTVTTDTTDPLLSVVAGPPTNTTPATAVEIDYDSAYFQDVNSGGVAVAKTWYVIPATNEGIITISGCAFGDLTTYKPSINIFEGLANANANITYQEFGFSGGSDLNTPFQVPIDSSKDYYYNAARNGAVAASTLQVSVLKSLSLPVPVGSIMVNDDTGGYICAMDVGTGYPIHFFTISLNPFGEGGCPLNNGTIILCRDDNDFPVIYDNQFNLIRELTDVLPNGRYNSTSSNLVGTFAVGTWPLGTPSGKFRLVSALGVVDPTDYDIGLGNINCPGLNNDASKLYFAKSNNLNIPINTWNILTNSAGPDLMAAVATESIPKGPIIVLQDGKILSPRFTSASPHHFIVKSVDNTGAPIHTYDLGAINTTNSNDSRLATDPADPTFFWAWGKENPGPGLSFFNKVKVSDGSLIVDLRNIVQYESGLYNATGTDTNTPIRFGHSESCPFWINRVELFGSNNAKSGLYILTGTGGNSGIPGNPILRHDVDWIDTQAGTSENVPIPDPFYDTYLVGDE